MSDRPGAPWSTHNSLTLLGWGTGVVVVLGSALYSLGVWRGASQLDPTESLKGQMVQVQAGVTALQTQNQALNAQLLEVSGRSRQLDLDLKRLEGALASIEKRGDERDAQQERTIEAVRTEQGTMRERLVVIERSSAGPLPGQGRR